MQDLAPAVRRSPGADKSIQPVTSNSQEEQHGTTTKEKALNISEAAEAGPHQCGNGKSGRLSAVP
jgi:hypothetical protein